VPAAIDAAAIAVIAAVVRRRRAADVGLILGGDVEVHPQVGIAAFHELVTARIHLTAHGFLEVAGERRLHVTAVGAEFGRERVGLVSLEVGAGRGIGADLGARFAGREYA